IASADARLSVLEVGWGLTPDMTGTVTLPSLVGLDVVKELTFTGRLVQGEEALRLGLVTRLAEDPLAAALELAREIASKSPAAVGGAKRLLNAAQRNGAAEQLALERHTFGALVGTGEQRA